jgi:hypothetical protein
MAHLKEELDFDSTWEQERETTDGQSSDALAGRAGGQGAQGRDAVAGGVGGLDAQEDTVTHANPTLAQAPSMAATGAAPHRHPSRFLSSEGAVRAPMSPFFAVTKSCAMLTLCCG